MGGGAIDPAVPVVAKDAVILEDVEDATHLREDQDATALMLHANEELIQHDHLAGVENQVLIRGVGGAWLRSIEQVRMVATLPELHDDVQQPGLRLAASHRPVDGIDVPFQDLLVPIHLHLRHAHVEIDLWIVVPPPPPPPAASRQSCTDSAHGAVGASAYLSSGVGSSPHRS